MTQLLNQLWQLQTIDSGLQRRQQAIAELDDGARAVRKLREAQAQGQALEAELRDLEATYRNKELELKSTEAERQDKSKRAYGGSVADTKELAALERKIEELKRRAGALEDDLLTLMESLEAKRELVAKSQALVKKLTTLARQIRKEYQETRAHLESEMAALQAERDALAPQLDPGQLREYDALRAKLGGLAVAKVEQEVCQGCRTVVPSALISRARGGRELVKCQDCRRILYVEP